MGEGGGLWVNICRLICDNNKILRVTFRLGEMSEG